MKTKEELLELISDVVNGEISDVKLDYPLSIETIVKYVEDVHNLKDTDEFDTNSWQWDYWMYFEGEQGRFCLSGTGYTATQKFYKDDIN